MVKIAKGFGMNVVAYTLHPNEERARKHKTTFLKLPELLKVSDIVTLHVPYDKKTHHMINKKNIKKFKKGNILLNTARGGLIETEAILYGIDNGILQGVGLDVLEEECGIKEERQLLSGKFKQECDLKTQLLDHVLLTKDNVLVTPHNAFNSNEALHKILEVTIENILYFIDKKPQNIV
jgi:D-lactate dehydrogenase